METFMVDEKHCAARRHFFEDHAEGWEDRNYSPEKLRRLESLLARVDLDRGMTVLDAGCGQGVLLPFLRRRVGGEGRLIALDASAAMLRCAAQRHPDAWILHAGVEAVPLLDGYVDAVICFSAFPHFSDKEATACEFYRLLKPGGAAYVLHIDGREKLNDLHDQHHAVCGDHLPCPHGMKKIFSQAGFSKMRADESAEHYYFAACKQE